VFSVVNLVPDTSRPAHYVALLGKL
jgi:hypothetical protein